MTAKISFKIESPDPFAKDLETRVKAYFRDGSISPHANTEMVIKTLCYVGGWAAIFVVVLRSVDAPLLALLLCPVLGFLSAGLGFNIGHDAIHGAYSRRRWLNRVMGHSFSAIGAHVYSWKILHNVIHHSYTNVAGADGDLHPVPALRFFASRENLKPYHRHQHFYAPLLYSMTSLTWAIKKDFDHIRKRSHLIFQKPALPRGQMSKLIFVKTAYFSTTVLLPWLVGFRLWQVLLGFLVMHVVQGLMLALTFQLGHLVEGPLVSQLDGSPLTQLGSWERHQLQSTANFAPRSLWAGWVFGGLHHQIEHHLFPQICHVHYPKLSKVVRATAADHGLPYYCHPTWFSALKSHFRLLKAYGRGEEPTVA